MARRAPQPTLSPKLLRHFAVATVAITACLALFADGEGRNELGREVAARSADAEQAVAEAGAKMKPKVGMSDKVRDARRRNGPSGFGGDEGGGYGEPMDTSSGGGGGSGIAMGPGAPGGPQDPAASGPIIPGPVMAGLPGSSATPPKGRRPAAPRRPSEEERANLEAMSRARSSAS